MSMSIQEPDISSPPSNLSTPNLSTVSIIINHHQHIQKNKNIHIQIISFKRIMNTNSSIVFSSFFHSLLLLLRLFQTLIYLISPSKEVLFEEVNRDISTPFLLHLPPLHRSNPARFIPLWNNSQATLTSILMLIQLII